MRLEKIENSTEIDNQIRILDYIDCGDFYLLIEWHNTKERMVILNQHTVLEYLQKKHGGDLYYSKLCKITFRLYESEEGILYSRNMDEAMNRTKVYDYDEYWECRILEALVTGKGLEDLDVTERIVRWPNKKGGRGESWCKLVEN
jgi:hypothetical protein